MSESVDLDLLGGVVHDLPPETQNRAALTVCRYATDVTEAADLLAMLGLGAPATCRECGAPMSRQTNLGRSDGYAGGGVCSRCGRAASMREERQASKTEVR